MAHDCDTLVIGGGIVGLSLAYELAGRGQQVTLLEAQQCGRAASWAGVGILPPTATRHLDDPLEQLRALSHRLLAQWSVELQTQTHIDTGYRVCGGIYLATTAGEAASLAANRAYWDELGIEVESLSMDQLQTCEPSLTPLANSGCVKAAVHLPGECQLRTPDYVQALKGACLLRGVSMDEDTNVTQLDCDQPHEIRVEANKGHSKVNYQATQVCLTARPWTATLLEQLGIASGILPIRGQVILFRERPGKLTRIINEGHRYLVPRDDGHILVGSNEEEVGFVCETTEPVLEELKSWAYGIMPELQQAVIEKSWAGLRPGSFDTYPYIGRLPDKPNVYVAAGHFRAGIHLSAGTAQVLAELITTGKSSIDLQPFRPGRG